MNAQGFKVLEGGELSVACARWEPKGWSPLKTDQLQDQIEAHCVASGKAWFSTVHHDRKKWLRFNMVNLYTQEHHIETLVALLCDAVDRVTKVFSNGAVNGEILRGAPMRFGLLRRRRLPLL